MLFPTNKREIQEIAKTYATKIDYDEFVSLYKEATQEPYNFFMVDDKTSEDCLKFWKNFNQLFVPCDPQEDSHY